MKHPLITIILLIFSLQATAQKILALDIMRFGKLKRVEYYRGDKIALKVKGSRKIYEGKLVAIGDSGFIVASKKSSDTIRLSHVRMILKSRANHLTEAFSKALVIFGVGFTSLDVVNNLLNNENTIVKPRAVITSACAISAGLLLKLYEIKRHRLGKRKKLTVIDLNPISY